MIENIFLAAGIVIIGRVFLDVFFLMKMDSFYKNDKLRLFIFGFLESVYGVSILAIIIGLMQTSWIYSLLYGVGAILGIWLSNAIKRKLDDKLEGQRKFFIRITIDDNEDYEELIWLLAERHFDFTVTEKKYLSGAPRHVIEGSLADRNRLNEVREILRGRKGKHVTIFRAEEAYMMR